MPNLIPIIPNNNALTKNELKKLIKRSDTKTLVEHFRIMKEKTEFIKENLLEAIMTRARKGDEFLSENKIKICERAKMSYNEKEILKFLKRKRLSEELIFDYHYTLNPDLTEKQLNKLLSQNMVIIEKKINPYKLEKFIDEHEIKEEVYNKFMTATITEYLKGLNG